MHYILEIDGVPASMPLQPGPLQFPSFEAAEQFVDGFSGDEVDYWELDPKTDPSENQSWSAVDDNGIEYVITEQRDDVPTMLTVTIEIWAGSVQKVEASGACKVIVKDFDNHDEDRKHSTDEYEF